MSADIVDLRNLPAPPHAEVLFREYVELRDRAQATLALQDGIAAGRAWGRFIREFERRPATASPAPVIAISNGATR